VYRNNGTNRIVTGYTKTSKTIEVKGDLNGWMKDADHKLLGLYADGDTTQLPMVSVPIVSIRGNTITLKDPLPENVEHDLKCVPMCLYAWGRGGGVAGRMCACVCV
jgi:hypothetical protein